MLQPEMKRLLQKLQGGSCEVDIERLITELEVLDEVKEVLEESLSMPSEVCPTCGRAWKKGGYIG